MTAANSAPAKGPRLLKKPIRTGKMPTKRTINLVLVDENKINPVKAVLGILAIVLLAGLFGKYLVYDRLAEVSQAQSRASRLQTSLSEAQALLDSFGDVETRYAHYTLDGMTAEELGLVDRPQIMRLVGDIIEEGALKFDPAEFYDRMERAMALIREARNAELDEAEYSARLTQEKENLPQPEITVQGWTVTGNVLTVDLTAQSLERLNVLARELEQNPIVDSCAISTANKDLRTGTLETDVRGRFIIYLRQPAEDEEVTQP